MFMILQQASDPATQGLIIELWDKYGVTGVVFGVLLFLILRQNKSAEQRVDQLEKAQSEQYMINLDTHKQMIADYVELVQNNTKVIADLTGCLNAIKTTLERLERKQE